MVNAKPAEAVLPGEVTLFIQQYISGIGYIIGRKQQRNRVIGATDVPNVFGCQEQTIEITARVQRSAVSEWKVLYIHHGYINHHLPLHLIVGFVNLGNTVHRVGFYQQVISAGCTGAGNIEGNGR